MTTATKEGLQVHELKCWPETFFAIKDGDKTAEFRRDDRGFKVGDLLMLREYIPTQDEWLAHGGSIEDWNEAFWMDARPADGSKWDGEDHDGDYWAFVPNITLPCYTGQVALVQVSHVQAGFGIPEGYVMLSIKPVRLAV